MYIEVGVYVSSKMNFHKEIICCGNALIEVKCHLVKPSLSAQVTSVMFLPICWKDTLEG